MYVFGQCLINLWFCVLIQSILFKSSLILALKSMVYTSTDFYNPERVHGNRVYFIIIRDILLVEAENKQKFDFIPFWLNFCLRYKNRNIRTRNKPWQMASTQYCIFSDTFPKQFFPPFNGAGLLHMRERVFVPIPQVAEHEDQCIQSDQWPSTRNENQSASNDNILSIV